MPKARPYHFVVFASLFFAATTQAQIKADAQDPSSFVRLDRVTASRATPNGIELHSGPAVVQITALREDVLRVRVGPQGQLPEDASWAVLPGSRASTVPVTPEGDGFKTGKLRVAIQRDPFQLRVTDLDGHVVAEQFANHPIEYNGSSFRVTMRSPMDEHYFGLGDKPGPLDRRNEAFTNWNTDAFGWQESTDPIYKSIPFFITFHQGISAGIFLDNTWRTNFEFNKLNRDAYSFGSENGPLDFYILYGPQPKQVVESWAWLTGHTPLPPLWALGFQQSRYSYTPESEVRRIASRLRSEHIPADVIWLDIGYQFKNRPFTVDPATFPHFDQMIQDLKAEHLKTVVITDLHIADVPHAGYKPYDEGTAGDQFVKNPDGSTYVGVVWPGKSVFPDFTRKLTRDWWGTLYTDFVHEGVAGFWNDMNEPAVFEVPSKTMPDDVQHRIDEPGFARRTATHLEIHNIFGMQNSRATFDGLLKIAPNTRPFVMTRASYAGGQRYAATWSGDNSSTWNHLRQTIPQLLNLGLSGFAMSGADVGGFAGSPQPELLTRWLEVAAFQPIDRDHTAIGTRQQEPWEDGTTHDLNLRRRYIEERYRLMPYIYTSAEEMSRTGLPLMRPLFLEFPEYASGTQQVDPSIDNEFLLGPDLLVAQSPYPDELDDYLVSLPPVGWYDYWTGARIDQNARSKDGDQQPPGIQVHPQIDQLPVFVRAGAIVPEQPLVQSTEEKPRGPLTVRVYPPVTPRESCSGSLYLDDGVSFDFKNGNFLRVDFSCERAERELTLRVSAPKGSFAPWWKKLSIEVYGAAKAAGQAQITSLEGSGRTLEQTAYDAQHHRVTIVVPDTGQGLKVKLAY